MTDLSRASAPFALVPPPLRDEPIDGYLEHLAHRLGIPLPALHTHLGLRSDSPFGPARGLTAAQARRLTAATSWSSEQIHSMTLFRYAAKGLMPTTATPGGGPGPWLRRRGARYCPACLRDRGMRWRLSWYLQWTFICTDHAVLLHNECPTCGRPPRTRNSGHPIVEPKAKVSETRETRSGSRCRCPVEALASADRDQGDPLDRSVPRALLEAQRTISRHVESDEAVHYLGLDRSSTEWLHDLAALCRLLVVNMPTEQIPAPFVDVLADRSTAHDRTHDAAGLRESLTAWEPYLGLTAFTAPAARFSEASTSRVTFALVASVAASTLLTSDPTQASRLLASILPAKVREEAARLSRSRGISWPLARILWLADHPALPAQARAIRLGSDRFRLDGVERAPLDRSRLPVRPWPQVRNALTWPDQNAFTGLATSVALLTAATRMPLRTACELLDHDHLATRVVHETTKFFRALVSTTEADVFDDLLHLHDAVTTARVPIDYERRRRAFAHPIPLSNRIVRRACRELGERPGDRIARFMSWWIYEQLTGNDVLLQPDLLNMPGGVRSLYARQRRTWDSHPPHALLRRAEHALLVNSIDEPITWSPVRNADGTWTCPPPDMTRALDWTHRPRRTASRHSISDTTKGLTMHELVVFARSGQSTRSERLDTMLVRFEEVAKTGSITHAARNLGISQPTMSVAMRTLEQQIDLPLLHRHHQAISLTDEGRKLHRLLERSSIDHNSHGGRVP